MHLRPSSERHSAATDKTATQFAQTLLRAQPPFKPISLEAALAAMRAAVQLRIIVAIHSQFRVRR